MRRRRWSRATSYELRTALADYLGRVRGVAAAPEQIVVTSGFWQGLGLVCRAPRRQLDRGHSG